MAKKTPKQVVRSSGNLFADMGLPEAMELDTKVRLGAVLNLIVERQKLTLAEVATKLSIKQAKTSALLGYRLGGFPVVHLMNFLVALGQDVDIVIKPKPASRAAHIVVKAACICQPRLSGGGH